MTDLVTWILSNFRIAINIPNMFDKHFLTQRFGLSWKFKIFSTDLPAWIFVWNEHFEFCWHAWLKFHQICDLKRIFLLFLKYLVASISSTIYYKLNFRTFLTNMVACIQWRIKGRINGVNTLGAKILKNKLGRKNIKLDFFYLWKQIFK